MDKQKNIRYPLSASQRWVFDHCLAYPASTQYNLPAVTRLVPEVDVPRLLDAWRELIAQRPVLRTRFALDENGEPRQWSDSAMQVTLNVREMSEAELADYLAHGFVRPFDLLSGEPLLRVEFVTTEKATVMLTDLQHAVFDGLTFNKLMWGRDLAHLYEGKKIGPAEQGLYEGAAAEPRLFGIAAPLTEAEQRSAEEYRQARADCLERFRGVHFTTLSRSPEGTSGPLVRHREYLPCERCDSLCQHLSTDAPSLFLAAFAQVLAQRTGATEVALCMKHHGRLQRTQLKSYGMFVRFLPLRLRLPIGALPVGAASVGVAFMQPALIQLLNSCRTEMDNAIKNATYPIAHLKRDLHTAPRLIYNFLALKGMDTCLHLEGAAMPTVLLEGGSTEDELSCNIYRWGDDYEIRVESGAGMNDRDIVEAVAKEIRAAVVRWMDDAGV